MIKIRSIQRLMYATSSVGQAGRPLMEAQIRRTRDRLNQGTDLFGNAFDGYKDDRPHPGHERPLMFASRLFDDMDYSVEPQPDGGVEIVGTITGEAAKIARYQNFNRRFLGFSTEDKVLSVRGVVGLIREAAKRWR